MMRVVLGAALAVAVAAATPAMAQMRVTTPAFEDGGMIPLTSVLNAFTCKGENHSPALSWSGAPKGTQSFAITMFDPDAPTGSGWWHWTVFDIPADIDSLPAGAGDAGAQSLPPGTVEGRTDFGFSHYGGPCPPVGDPPHHYEITVYAVKVPKLEGLDANSSGALVGFMLHFNTLAKARIVGRYGRPR